MGRGKVEELNQSIIVPGDDSLTTVWHAGTVYIGFVGFLWPDPNHLTANHAETVTSNLNI